MIAQSTAIKGRGGGSAECDRSYLGTFLPRPGNRAGWGVIADGEVSSRQVMSLQRYSRHASALNFRAPFLDGHPASSTDISAETRAIGRCPQAAAGRPLDIGLAIASMGAEHE